MDQMLHAKGCNQPEDTSPGVTLRSPQEFAIVSTPFTPISDVLTSLEMLV